MRKIKLDDIYPNARRKPWWEKLPPEEQKQAVKALLSTGSLFQGASAGYLLTADLLCAMHCRALRKAEPSFRPAISAKSGSPEIEEALEAIVRAVVTKKRWKEKHAKLRRSAVLDYRTQSGGFPRHIQDFSRLKVSVKGYKPLKIPAAYEDTVLLIIGAKDASIKEASPYLENAAVILLNSENGDLTPTKLLPSSIASYDPGVVALLGKYRKQIASLLYWWWGRFNVKDEDAWARQIVQEARASFGKQDERYIRVELDPKKLRDAIRYRVLLSFLDELEYSGFITAEELAPYRQAAEDVFDPAPPEPVVLRKVEDPEVFREIMRDLAAANADSIVAEKERFVKSDKPFGAWRTISKKRYLVMLEDDWAKAYAKAARSRKDLETSFFEQKGWEKDMQKVLAEKDYIKNAASNHRYRYDLFEKGNREGTYVVAIPDELLKN